MSDYTIGITTFSRRLNDLTALVKQVRQYSKQDIILAINCDY